MLGIEPEKTIYDLVVAPGELDTEKLAGYVTRHASGLDILPAPLRPEDAELVTEAKLAQLLEVARESYDIIVVDTSPFFHGPMLATLDRTDELLLLCGLDVPTLKNVRLALQTLELLSFPPDRIRVVLNRANSKVGMKPGEVEGALEVKVRFEIPSDRAVPLSVNRGNPAVLAEAKGDFARAIRTMAKTLLLSRPRRRTSAAGSGGSGGSPRSHQERERHRQRERQRRARGALRRCPAPARIEPADGSRSVRGAERPASITPASRSSVPAFSFETTENLTDQVMRAVTQQLALDRTLSPARSAGRSRARSPTTSSGTGHSSRSCAMTP